MALTMSVDYENGSSSDSSYIKVQAVGGNKENCVIEVHCFFDEVAYQEGKAVAKRLFFNFIPSVEDGSENFIKQSYEYLKTLPEFASAGDC